MRLNGNQNSSGKIKVNPETENNQASVVPAPVAVNLLGLTSTVVMEKALWGKRNADYYFPYYSVCNL